MCSRVSDTPSDALSVSLADAEKVREALDAAYHQNVVLDLHDNYRSRKAKHQPSALTRTLKGALDFMDGVVQINDGQEEGLDE